MIAQEERYLENVKKFNHQLS
jgi:hypothetical protein